MPNDLLSPGDVDLARAFLSGEPVGKIASSELDAAREFLGKGKKFPPFRGMAEPGLSGISSLPIGQRKRIALLQDDPQALGQYLGSIGFEAEPPSSSGRPIFRNPKTGKRIVPGEFMPGKLAGVTLPETLIQGGLTALGGLTAPVTGPFGEIAGAGAGNVAAYEYEDALRKRYGLPPATRDRTREFETGAAFQGGFKVLGGLGRRLLGLTQAEKAATTAEETIRTKVGEAQEKRLGTIGDIQRRAAAKRAEMEAAKRFKAETVVAPKLQKEALGRELGAGRGYARELLKEGAGVQKQFAPQAEKQAAAESLGVNLDSPLGPRIAELTDSGALANRARDLYKTAEQTVHQEAQQMFENALSGQRDKVIPQNNFIPAVKRIQKFSYDIGKPLSSDVSSNLRELAGLTKEQFGGTAEQLTHEQQLEKLAEKLGMGNKVSVKTLLSNKDVRETLEKRLEGQVSKLETEALPEPQAPAGMTVNRLLGLRWQFVETIMSATDNADVSAAKQAVTAIDDQLAKPGMLPKEAAQALNSARSAYRQRMNVFSRGAKLKVGKAGSPEEVADVLFGKGVKPGEQLRAKLGIKAIRSADPDKLSDLQGMFASRMMNLAGTKGNFREFLKPYADSGVLAELYPNSPFSNPGNWEKVFNKIQSGQLSRLLETPEAQKAYSEAFQRAVQSTAGGNYRVAQRMLAEVPTAEKIAAGRIQSLPSAAQLAEKRIAGLPSVAETEAAATGKMPTPKEAAIKGLSGRGLGFIEYLKHYFIWHAMLAGSVGGGGIITHAPQVAIPVLGGLVIDGGWQAAMRNPKLATMFWNFATSSGSKRAGWWAGKFAAATLEQAGSEMLRASSKMPATQQLPSFPPELQQQPEP